MFLSTEAQKAYLESFDKVQSYPIELFVIVRDAISIATNSGNILIGGTGISFLQAEDVIYGNGINNKIVSVGVGSAAITPAATGTGLFSVSLLRPVKQSNGSNPRVHELAPKGLAMLGQMSDRIFTRAWTARIVKGAMPSGELTGEKRYALRLPDRGIVLCSLIDNVASETQNPELAHNFYLIAG